ncbi:MAG: DUF4411 family protein [Coriobacteriales bacterium]|nr:DUF4411 family protein [Coriobacteriales bacterium]
MVLDANAPVEPKNCFYAFDFCPGFWDFLVDDFDNGNAMSIIHVRDELLAGGDDLSKWIKDTINKVHFFDCAGDPGVVAKQRDVASYVMGAYTRQNVISDFLSPRVADPWIAAYALAYGGTVVTQEQSRSKRKKVSLVDVCGHFGIHHVNLFEFLRAEKAKFVYQRQGTSLAQP